MTRPTLTDNLVGIFSPRARLDRIASRAKTDLLVTSARSTLRAQRSYDGARNTRFTRDWRATSGSADVEISRDLPTLRARSADLEINNPYVASAVRQLVGNLIGDGMEARAVHPDPRIQKIAQEAYLEWARSKVDGRHDFYGIQRLAVRTMIVRGDVCIAWSAVGNVPDARLTLIEGDQLSSPQQFLTTQKPRVQDGVEYDGSGDRAAYHILDDHPGSILGGLIRTTRRVEAQHVDHLFEPTRPGQTRGVPWLVPSITKLRELQELSDSIRTKKRMQACVGLIRTLSESEAEEPETGTDLAAAEGAETASYSGSPALDRLTPGMVAEGLPGEQFTAFQPSADGDSDVFFRQELRSVAASIGLPDHLMTGDVSQANYSSLRAAMVAFWTLLDDWQANIIQPFLLDPAFVRLMRRKALELREPKLAEVRAEWTRPTRYWVDPIKDVAALIMEERAGYVNKSEALARRGINWRDHFKERAVIQAEGDQKGLVFDTDPRRVNGSGALQPPAGFVLPKTDNARGIDPAVVGFFGRMIEAVEASDADAINQGFIEAATAFRNGDPAGPAMAAIIAALTGSDEPENRPPEAA